MDGDEKKTKCSDAEGVEDPVLIDRAPVSKTRQCIERKDVRQDNSQAKGWDREMKGDKNEKMWREGKTAKVRPGSLGKGER